MLLQQVPVTDDEKGCHSKQRQPRQNATKRQSLDGWSKFSFDKVSIPCRYHHPAPPPQITTLSLVVNSQYQKKPSQLAPPATTKLATTTSLIATSTVVVARCFHYRYIVP